LRERVAAATLRTAGHGVGHRRAERSDRARAGQRPTLDATRGLTCSANRWAVSSGPARVSRDQFCEQAAGEGWRAVALQVDGDVASRHQRAVSPGPAGDSADGGDDLARVKVDLVKQEVIEGLAC
jgi:hypothetical protein